MTAFSIASSFPLILKEVAENKNYPHVDKAEIYKDWKVNDASKTYPKPLV